MKEYTLENRDVVYVRMKPGKRRPPQVWQRPSIPERILAARGTVVEEFEFGTVFSPDLCNLDVFDGLNGEALLDNVIHGVRETVMAYGQTGSGKTHSIFGSFDEPGLLQIFVHRLFQKIHERGIPSTVRLSCIEIVGDQLTDMTPNLQRGVSDEFGSPPFGIIETFLKTSRYYYKRIQVSSVEQTLALLENVREVRKVGQSLLNDQSSRSHAVVQFFVDTPYDLLNQDPTSSASGKNHANGSTMSTVTSTVPSSVHHRVGTLTLVDLAGSEREFEGVSSDGRIGARILNTSLSQLNKLLRNLQAGQLSEADKRQGALNRFLFDYLSSGCGVAIIFCISPDCGVGSSSTLSMAANCLAIDCKRRPFAVALAAPPTKTTAPQLDNLGKSPPPLASLTIPICTAEASCQTEECSYLEKMKNGVTCALKTRNVKLKRSQVVDATSALNSAILNFKRHSAKLRSKLKRTQRELRILKSEVSALKLVGAAAGISFTSAFSNNSNSINNNINNNFGLNCAANNNNNNNNCISAYSISRSNGPLQCCGSCGISRPHTPSCSSMSVANHPPAISNFNHSYNASCCCSSTPRCACLNVKKNNHPQFQKCEHNQHLINHTTTTINSNNNHDSGMCLDNQYQHPPSFLMSRRAVSTSSGYKSSLLQFERGADIIEDAADESPERSLTAYEDRMFGQDQGTSSINTCQHHQKNYDDITNMRVAITTHNIVHNKSNKKRKQSTSNKFGDTQQLLQAIESGSAPRVSSSYASSCVASSTSASVICLNDPDRLISPCESPSSNRHLLDNFNNNNNNDDVCFNINYFRNNNNICTEAAINNDINFNSSRVSTKKPTSDGRSQNRLGPLSLVSDLTPQRQQEQQQLVQNDNKPYSDKKNSGKLNNPNIYTHKNVYLTQSNNDDENKNSCIQNNNKKSGLCRTMSFSQLSTIQNIISNDDDESPFSHVNPSSKNRRMAAKQNFSEDVSVGNDIMVDTNNNFNNSENRKISIPPRQSFYEDQLQVDYDSPTLSRSFAGLTNRSMFVIDGALHIPIASSPPAQPDYNQHSLIPESSLMQTVRSTFNFAPNFNHDDDDGQESAKLPDSYNNNEQNQEKNYTSSVESNCFEKLNFQDNRFNDTEHQISSSSSLEDIWSDSGSSLEEFDETEMGGSTTTNREDKNQQSQKIIPIKLMEWKCSSSQTAIPLTAAHAVQNPAAEVEHTPLREFNSQTYLGATNIQDEFAVTSVNDIENILSPERLSSLFLSSPALSSADISSQNNETLMHHHHGGVTQHNNNNNHHHYHKHLISRLPVSKLKQHLSISSAAAVPPLDFSVAPLHGGSSMASPSFSCAALSPSPRVRKDVRKLNDNINFHEESSSSSRGKTITIEVDKKTHSFHSPSFDEHSTYERRKQKQEFNSSIETVTLTSSSATQQDEGRSVTCSDISLSRSQSPSFYSAEKTMGIVLVNSAKIGTTLKEISNEKNSISFNGGWGRNVKGSKYDNEEKNQDATNKSHYDGFQ